MNLANFPFSRMRLIALHVTGFTITEDTSKNYFWAPINHSPTQSTWETYWVRTMQWTKPADETVDRVSMTKTIKQTLTLHLTLNSSLSLPPRK